jgi:arsenate reductase (glutaredoxin)
VSVILYHNSTCSKSRQVLRMLEQRGIEARVIEYLKTPPSAQELDDLLRKLGLEPRELMRIKDDVYVEAGLADERLTRAQLIAGMVANPSVIERPIVVNGARAALGRPPERVLEILDTGA